MGGVCFVQDRMRVKPQRSILWAPLFSKFENWFYYYLHVNFHLVLAIPSQVIRHITNETVWGPYGTVVDSGPGVFPNALISRGNGSLAPATNTAIGGRRSHANCSKLSPTPTRRARDPHTRTRSGCCTICKAKEQRPEAIAPAAAVRNVYSPPCDVTDTSQPPRHPPQPATTSATRTCLPQYRCTRRRKSFFYILDPSLPDRVRRIRLIII